MPWNRGDLRSKDNKKEKIYETPMLMANKEKSSKTNNMGVTSYLTNRILL